MKLAVMQPYFLPYPGYFMLLGAVDHFVIFDDVQYIVRGFVNRNKLLLNGQAHPFMLPVRKASQQALINEVVLDLNDQTRRKLLELFRHAYAKAPRYRDVRELLLAMFALGETRLEPFVTRSLRLVCDYLGLATPLSRSSELDLGPGARGRDKIIPLCRHFQASHYVNAIGGMALYVEQPFTAQGIALRFLRPHTVCYNQFDLNFVPNLSIVDVLMFNSPEDCRALLNQCSLVTADGKEENV